MPTPHAKLRIAKPSGVPDGVWRADLLLWLASQPGGAAAVKAALKQRVPEYQPG